MDNVKMVEVRPYFKEVAEEKGFYKPERMSLIAQHGTIRGMQEIPEDVQAMLVGVVAHRLRPLKSSHGAALASRDLVLQMLKSVAV